MVRYLIINLMVYLEQMCLKHLSYVGRHCKKADFYQFYLLKFFSELPSNFFILRVKS